MTVHLFLSPALQRDKVRVGGVEWSGDKFIQMAQLSIGTFALGGSKKESNREVRAKTNKLPGIITG